MTLLDRALAPLREPSPVAWGGVALGVVGYVAAVDLGGPERLAAAALVAWVVGVMLLDDYLDLDRGSTE